MQPKVGSEDKVIKTVAQFIDDLRRAPSGRRRLFRGQNTDQPLLPKIARLAARKHIPFSKVTDLERQMLQRFRRESVPMLAGTKADTPWELLSIAQHWGMPTRLLDWTSSALAGLWFAVAADPPDDEQYGVVWAMDVDPENEKSPDPADDIFDLKRTVVFQPFHLDRRIVAQSGWFSVHRYTAVKDKFLPLEDNARFRTCLSRYVVPRSSLGALRRELRLLGVSQVTMFPDLSGLGADIQAEFVDSWRPTRTI